MVGGEGLSPFHLCFSAVTATLYAEHHSGVIQGEGTLRWAQWMDITGRQICEELKGVESGHH